MISTTQQIKTILRAVTEPLPRKGGRKRVKYIKGWSDKVVAEKLGIDNPSVVGGIRCQQFGLLPGTKPLRKPKQVRDCGTGQYVAGTHTLEEQIQRLEARFEELVSRLGGL